MNPSDNPLEQNTVVERRQREFLPSSVILEQTQRLPNNLIVTGVMVGFFCIFIIWSILVDLEEVTRTQGEVMPKSLVRVVQHADGGTIEKILVHNGDPVEAGKTVLLYMEPVNAKSELQQMQSRESSLVIDAERLREFAGEHGNDFRAWLDKYMKALVASGDNEAHAKQLIQDELLLFESQVKSRSDQREIALSQIQQYEEQAKLLVEQKAILTRHVDLLNQEKAMYSKLDSISKKDYIDFLSQLNRAQGDLTIVLGEIQKNQQALFEAKNKYNNLNSSLRQQAIQDLDKINSELGELRESIKKLTAKVERLKVVAPISGIINDVMVETGSVLQPGGKLLEIVPSDRQLIVETKIPPNEVGYMHPGDVVKVKVLTYDFSRYGMLTGKLRDVSATTYSDNKGNTYYKGVVELDKLYVGKDPTQNKLISGMTVEADIITGKKSLMSYLLKPIHRSLTTAFHER